MNFLKGPAKPGHASGKTMLYRCTSVDIYTLMQLGVSCIYAFTFSLCRFEIFYRRGYGPW